MQVSSCPTDLKVGWGTWQVPVATSSSSLSLSLSLCLPSNNVKTYVTQISLSNRYSRGGSEAGRERERGGYCADSLKGYLKNIVQIFKGYCADSLKGYLKDIVQIFKGYCADSLKGRKRFPIWLLLVLHSCCHLYFISPPLACHSTKFWLLLSQN